MSRSACRRVLGEFRSWRQCEGSGWSEGALQGYGKVQYTTALLLCRTATTGKRGGRQGESTTWVESLSVNVGCGSCWGLGSGEVRTWRHSRGERLKAAARTEVERADWKLCNVTTHHLLVYISEMCRYLRLRPHPHSCPHIEKTRSSQSGRSGSDSDSHAVLVWRLSPDKRCSPLPIPSVAVNAMHLQVFL